MRVKPPFWATIMSLLGIFILCALGLWQLQRLEWKNRLLQTIEAEYAKDATTLLISPENLEKDFEFKRGTVRGTYNFNRQIMIGPRVYEGLPGWHLLAALELEDGSFLLANRGWVPQSWNPEQEEGNRQDQTTSITGLLRKPTSGNPFSPENRPDKNQWYRIDFAQIAKVFDIEKIHRYVLYPETHNESWTEYPVIQPEKPELNNHHLYYAIFWFMMAGALAVIYTLRFVIKR